MSEAIPYSPECFHGVENRILQDRDSGCPTSRRLQPGEVLNAKLYLGDEDSKGGYTLVTLSRIATPYRDSVDGTRDRVTYQKFVTQQRYGLVRCDVGIWPSHQRDDMFKAGADVDLQRH